MKLCFDSIEETREFVKNLKGTRTGKGGETDDSNPGTGGQQAPAPIQPPQGQPGTFNPGGAMSFPSGGAAMSGPSPEVLALVQRIAARIDWCLTPAPQGGGQDAGSILTWFRGQCGAEAANYTMDQIKQVALPRAAMPTLNDIAKLMNA